MVDESKLVFPGLFALADGTSLNGQRRFITATKIQLGLLLVAGGIGALTWETRSMNFAALAAGCAFLIAGAFRLRQLTGTPAQTWYEGRAAAESVKTLSWLYAVGGAPFPTTLSAEEAHTQFEEQLSALVTDLESIAPGSAVEHRPTESMDNLRRMSLQARRDAYRKGRIQDQQTWYSSKARDNGRKARLWSRMVLGFEALGAVGAFLSAFKVVEIDMLGLAGAGAATGAAWLETKQHDNLASAYNVAAQELESILSLIGAQENEHMWTQFVADAEQAISREHTLWRARTLKK